MQTKVSVIREDGSPVVLDELAGKIVDRVLRAASLSLTVFLNALLSNRFILRGSETIIFPEASVIVGSDNEITIRLSAQYYSDKSQCRCELGNYHLYPDGCRTEFRPERESQPFQELTRELTTIIQEAFKGFYQKTSRE